jgi:hypothetical protein
MGLILWPSENRPGATQLVMAHNAVYASLKITRKGGARTLVIKEPPTHSTCNFNQCDP